MRAFRLSHVGIVAALGMAFAMELSAATPSVFQADSGATCAVPAKTLSFDCGSACELYEPCMLTSPVTASCDLECFTIDSASPSAYKYFNFLIPYDSTVGDTKTTAHKNNSALTKVATTKLPVSTTDVIIRGGSWLGKSEQGRVANVEFAENFLSDETQLTFLHLANLNLAPKIDALTKNFPPRIQILWLVNVMLVTLPMQVTSYKNLATLTLSNNYITEVNQSHVISQLTIMDLAYNSLNEVPAIVRNHTKLQTLHLSGNKIFEFTQEDVVATVHTFGMFGNFLVAFDVYFPNLVYLNLAQNLFRAIPPAIFKHMTLRELYLQDNTQLKNVTLTNEQANFINTLDKFSIDNSSFSKNCDDSQKTTVLTYTVCITGGAVNTTTINGPRLAAVSTSSKTAASGSGSNTTAGTVAPANSDKDPQTITDVIPMTAQSSSSGTKTALLVLVCLAGVLAVALIVAFVYLKRHKPGNDKTLSKSVSEIDNEASSVDNGAYLSLWNDPDLLAIKVNAAEIQDIVKIGQGAFCDVWLVQYTKPARLASKRLREVSRSGTQMLIEEIKLVATLKHSSIVKFIGAAWTQEADLQALFEYMENGDLRTYLENEKTPRSWSLEKIQFAIDIVEALVYVHSFNPPLVHRDLKSRNVLLSESMQAKLTDFGVSRYQSEKHTMTAGVGTARWLAPEVITGQSDYGPAADVFSFGVVLSELDSHKLPYEDARSKDGNKLVDVAIMDLVSAGKLRPNFLETCPPKIAKLADLCLSLRPEDRPTAVEVAFVLRTLKKRLSSGSNV